jgi:hypothetical protein
MRKLSKATKEQMAGVYKEATRLIETTGWTHGLIDRDKHNKPCVCNSVGLPVSPRYFSVRGALLYACQGNREIYNKLLEHITSLLPDNMLMHTWCLSERNTSVDAIELLTTAYRSL